VFLNSTTQTRLKKNFFAAVRSKAKHALPFSVDSIHESITLRQTLWFERIKPLRATLSSRPYGLWNFIIFQKYVQRCQCDALEKLNKVGIDHSK
jgi:hypothetical protein